MSEFQKEGDFELSADALWRVVRDFGDVSWLPGHPDFESAGGGVGMIRTIRTPRLPAVRERLDAIDEAGRAIHYALIEGNPMPVRDYRATMKVVDLGAGRSRLEWSSRWEPDGVSEREARAAVDALYTGVLGAMKANLEKG